jgi:hypothetical protein
VDAGAVILIVAMLLLVPAILTGGLVVAAILGWTLKAEAEHHHQGSELIDLNR